MLNTKSDNKKYKASEAKTLIGNNTPGDNKPVHKTEIRLYKVYKDDNT